jgi:predicted porin
MKKELLLATALTGALVVPGVAQAATASLSGSVFNGIKGSNADSSSTSDSYAEVQEGAYSLSVSETTDGGMKISSGFTISNEGAASVTESGLTLTFTDGSSLELIDAGTAYAGAMASIPSASGEQGVSATSGNTASTSLTWGSKADGVGFDWNSAADFAGVEGLTFGVSGAFSDDLTLSADTVQADSTYSVGATYVTTSGDTTITIGGGYVNAGSANTNALNDASSSAAVSLSAVTGDLTVGVGVSTGAGLAQETSVSASEIDNVQVMNAGAQYVSGDMTFKVSYKDGSVDEADLGSDGAVEDAKTVLGASVDYAVASGVTATLGYSDSADKYNGADETDTSGTGWYIGASISF